MAGPHQPFGLPDSDLPHQKYMYVCMYVCIVTGLLTRPPLRGLSLREPPRAQFIPGSFYIPVGFFLT